MSLISTVDCPPVSHFKLYDDCRSLEKRADVRLSGLLQAIKTGHLIVGVPASLVRGVFDAMDEPGITLPSSVDGGTLKAGIVVMSPEEVESIGGPSKITERGKQFSYQLGELIERPAKNWPGISSCWHLKIISPELGKLRRTYGLPTKLDGSSDFSIVVACRKVGVLSSSSVSKAITSQNSQKLPDWLK